MAGLTDFSVSLLVPWQPDGAERDRNWRWLRERYAREHPDIEIVEGRHEGPWCKAAAVGRAAERATGDVFVIADADVWCDGLGEAFGHLETWAVPHYRVHRLADASSLDVMAGADPEGLPLDQGRYIGLAGGGMVVMRAEVYRDVPLDRHFVGWGHEDDSWRDALNALVGKPWRGTAPLWHLWHPPQPRRRRDRGSDESRARRREYVRARKNPAAIRRLVEEGRWQSTPSSTGCADARST